MGMLFDHGLDATSAVVVMYQIGRFHNMGGGLMLLVFIMMSTVPFYYVTLQEYYLGKMVLPAFSGPDDISLGIIGLCFYTAYYGSELWLKEIDLGFGNVRYNALFVYCALSLEFFSILHSVISNLY